MSPLLNEKRADRAYEFNRIIGDNIRRARTNAGVSQQALAEAADIDTSQISRIEQATRTLTFQQAIAIANYLDVPLMSLTLQPKRSKRAA